MAMCPLCVQGTLESLLDWRLRCRPPLVLQNLLPVAGQYALWQRPWEGGGGQLRLSGSGRLEAGGTINVYCVDTRQAVHLTFQPEGCEYSEGEPVMISDGRLGGEDFAVLLWCMPLL
jgi:vacuolar protein sorting-associated protein 13A/C